MKYEEMYIKRYHYSDVDWYLLVREFNLQDRVYDITGVDFEEFENGTAYLWDEIICDLQDFIEDLLDSIPNRIFIVETVTDYTCDETKIIIIEILHPHRIIKNKPKWKNYDGVLSLEEE